MVGAESAAAEEGGGPRVDAGGRAPPPTAAMATTLCVVCVCVKGGLSVKNTQEGAFELMSDDGYGEARLLTCLVHPIPP